ADGGAQEWSPMIPGSQRYRTTVARNRCVVSGRSRRRGFAHVRELPSGRAGELPRARPGEADGPPHLRGQSRRRGLAGGASGRGDLGGVGAAGGGGGGGRGWL